MPRRGILQLLGLESLSSQIPDVARNYTEFQEPLVALDE